MNRDGCLVGHIASWREETRLLSSLSIPISLEQEFDERANLVWMVTDILQSSLEDLSSL